jgi:tRNA G10  N-methylase Trm11
MQSQCRHEKEKYQQDAQLDKKQENQSSKFFLVDFEEMRRPRCAGVPKQERRGEIEQSEDQANNECGEEKVPEENNFVAVHARDYLLERRQINHESIADIAL